MDKGIINNLLDIVTEIGDSKLLTKAQASSILEIFCKSNKIKFEHILTKDKYEFDGVLFDSNFIKLLDNEDKFVRIAYSTVVNPILNFIVAKIILVELTDEYEIVGKLNTDNVAWFNILDNPKNEMIKVIALRNVFSNMGGLTVKYFVTEVTQDYLYKTIFPVSNDRIPNYATNFAIHLYKEELYKYIENSLEIPDNYDNTVIREAYDLYVSKKYKFSIADVVFDNRLEYIRKVMCKCFECNLRTKLRSTIEGISGKDVGLITSSAIKVLPNEFRSDANNVYELQQILENYLLNNKDDMKNNEFDKNRVNIAKDLLNKDSIIKEIKL